MNVQSRERVTAPHSLCPAQRKNILSMSFALLHNAFPDADMGIPQLVPAGLGPFEQRP